MSSDRSRLALIALVLSSLIGCGPSTPVTGERVELPADYKDKESKIVEGFRQSYLDKMKAAGKEKRVPPQFKDQAAPK